MGADLHILVDAADAGTRLDAFLGSREGCPTRSACARLIEAGGVAINGETCLTKKQPVAAGDRISVELPDVADPGVVLGEPIPLDIRYEDDYLIVLSKQRGLVCHPAHGHESGTLANALVYHCGADHLGLVQGEDRPGIVHRLDRDTSGLMVAAKDDDTQRALQNLIRTRTLDRRYITLVHGEVTQDQGTISTGIARSTRDRQKMAVSDDPFARQAITTFRVLERFEPARGDEGYTLLECHLYTGRTHQIRVPTPAWAIRSTGAATIAPTWVSRVSFCIHGASRSSIPSRGRTCGARTSCRGTSLLPWTRSRTAAWVAPRRGMRSCPSWDCLRIDPACGVFFRLSFRTRTGTSVPHAVRSPIMRRRSALRPFHLKGARWTSSSRPSAPTSPRARPS